MALCLCGCGGKVEIGKKSHIPNKYIFGHHGKGKLLSEEHKLKLLKSKEGIPRSEKTKMKISNTKKGKPNGHKGLKHSEPSKMKMSLSHLGQKSWNKGLHPEYLSGSNHYNWKGGVTLLYNKIRNCLEYKEWRIQVFSRDNFTCQNCNKKSEGDLNAHHKHKFSDIIIENNIRSLNEALQCNYFWDINNGITLCEKCHEKIDVV